MSQYMALEKIPGIIYTVINRGDVVLVEKLNKAKGNFP